MSQWIQERYVSTNMMSMPSHMIDGGAIPGSHLQGSITPLMPPMLPGLLEIGNGNTAVTEPQTLPMPGPQAMPPGFREEEIQEALMEDQNQEISNSYHKSSSRGSRDKRDGRGGSKERSRRRSRSRDRHGERYDRSRNGGRDRDRRDRRTKWSSNDDKEPVMPGMVPAYQMPSNMVMATGGMMQYNPNMINNMMPQQMEMQNMMNVQGMPNMMSAVPNMMMEQNMMAMYPQQTNQMMAVVPNQPIYVNNGTLLPPTPGTLMPQRRQCPPGCRTIFVGGLPEMITEDTLKEIFQRFGNIVDLKLNQRGFCHIRFETKDSVEPAFILSGYRFKYQNQTDSEGTILFVDYALNRDDQNEFEKSIKMQTGPPPRIEHFNQINLNSISEKIKSEDQFSEAAPSLEAWLTRGECNKRNANQFYSMIQATNNQVRRLLNDKMAVDEEYSTFKSTMRDKFLQLITQFEQVAKIMAAAKHQRVWDHFTKQQRRNIEMWHKMTLEIENMKEEFNAYFDEDDDNKCNKKMVSEEKYEELRRENENLIYELEGYKNEAHLAKDEAERKFETFKAYFIAQQALQNKQGFTPLPLPPMINPPLPQTPQHKPAPPPPLPDDMKVPLTGPTVSPTEARLISIVTAFLLVHPLGASLEYIVSYVRSMMPKINQTTVYDTLQKYTDVFAQKTTGVGASIEQRWTYITFDTLKIESAH